MKKSTLRKLIRESIKQLMNEQASGQFQYTQGSLPSGDCKRIFVNKCDENPNYGNGPVPISVCAYIDGNVPQVGDTFLVPAAYANHYSGIYTHVAGHVVKIYNIQNPPAWHGGSSYTNITSTPCSTQPPQPTSGCDPNGSFPSSFNLQNWTNTWTSLPNFSSSNPNQPCNFVCQRKNQWTAQLAAGGMGPAQTNMIECKLAEATNQYQIHNCANSSANNCP